jgi:hypothetical protein
MQHNCIVREERIQATEGMLLHYNFLDSQEILMLIYSYVKYH